MPIETAAPASPSAGMPVTVSGQYIKDFSFENPNAPQIFAPAQAAPEISMGVNIHTRAVGPNAYEVLLAMKIDAKLVDKVAFISDLVYGGVFNVPPMPEEQLRLFLLIEAPRLLFPFARGIMTNAIREGGFHQVMIGPIDFYSLYLANKDKVGSMPAAGAA